MTLPRTAVLAAAAALSLAGCAHGPARQASAPGLAPGAQAESPAPQEAPARQDPSAETAALPVQAAPAPIHQVAARAPAPAPVHEAPSRAVPAPPPVHSLAARAPVHNAAPRAPEPRAASPAARAPVHNAAPAPVAPAPALRPAAPPPVYEARRPAAPAPVHAAPPPVYAAPAAPPPVYAAPAYAAPAPAESYMAAGPRRLGEMAPVRDREDGRAAARSASAAASPRRYATPDGDLMAPPPGELRRVASRGPVSAGRSFGFDSGLGPRLVEAARAQTRSPVRYDGAYVKLDYPWGDVPGNTGVCTDVIVRAYRQMGFDFQQMMHEDMREAFAYYPSAEIYGLKAPDPNIDHRRVVNMEAFLERHAQNLTPTRNPGDYQPGDIVSWRISGTQPHMGIVSDKRDDRTGTPYIIHNIGAGVKEENMLFLSPPVGHYRFAPSSGSGPIRTAGL